MDTGETRQEATRVLAHRYPMLHRSFLAQTQGTDTQRERLGTLPGRADVALEAIEVAAGPVDAIGRFNAAVQVRMNQGYDRKQAVASVAKERPELHAQYVAATNDQDPQVQSLIRERFAANL